MILYPYILGYLSAVSAFPVQPNLSTQDDEAGHQSHFHTTETSVCLAIYRVQELCESRGGRPGLSVLTSLMVPVCVKRHRTMLTHWSQFVPNMSTDI